VERPTVGPTSPERNPDGLCRGHTCRSPAGCARDAGAAAPAALLPSPDSWQDEVVYFLLVDRFRDGAESTRPLLDRTKLTDARPDQANGEPWRWDHWAFSGSDRYLLARLGPPSCSGGRGSWWTSRRSALSTRTGALRCQPERDRGAWCGRSGRFATQPAGFDAHCDHEFGPGRRAGRRRSFCR
jgi:hypothetical protein